MGAETGAFPRRLQMFTMCIILLFTVLIIIFLIFFIESKELKFKIKKDESKIKIIKF